ncbi:MAG: WecB/TagA/CpsF family glycosyltransferase [Chloroflexi bacterium]|nr:WecB/TagA/CpsF family glycosyltransferase [Chloroflexota bacterium]MYB16554.1 WecB/TagA/CpsF family glycosyltransferase [Chloroflexota bacterium]
MPEAAPRPARVAVLGVPLADCGRGLALAWIRGWLHGREPRAVFTVNPEFVMAARSDPEFAETLANADLNLVDGAGLLAAARLCGRQRPQRLPGVDLIPELCRICAAGGHPVYLLGGRSGAAAQAAANLLRDHPGLTIAGTAEPDDPAERTAAICLAVRESGAHLLLVAFGTPRQEMWISTHMAKTGARVVVGVGGSFDLISGRIRRAPRLVRRIGMEWLYRLVREPWRWRRQRVLPRFALLALRQALRQRLGAGRAIQ